MSRGHGRFEPNERLPKFGDYRNGQMGSSMSAAPFPASSEGLAPPQLARRQQRPDYRYDYPQLPPSGAAGGGEGRGGDQMTGGSLTQPEFPSDSDTTPLPAANTQQLQQQPHFQPARRLDTGGSGFRSSSRPPLQPAMTTAGMTLGYRSNNNNGSGSGGGHGRHGGGPAMPITNSSYNDLSSGSENMFQEYHRLFQQQHQQQLLHQQQRQQLYYQQEQQQQQQYHQQPSRYNMYLKESSRRQSSADMTLPTPPLQVNNYAESADRRRRRFDYNEDFDVEDSQRRRHRGSARQETPADFVQPRHQQQRYHHQRHQRSRPVADTEYDGSSSSNDGADEFFSSNPPDDLRMALRRDRGSRRHRRGTTLADSSAEMSMLSPMPQPPPPMALSPTRQAMRQRQAERQRRQKAASARQAWLPSFNEAAYFNNTNNGQQQQQQQLPFNDFSFPPSRGSAAAYPQQEETRDFSSGEDSRRPQRGHRRRVASEGARVAGFAGVGWRENGRSSETVFSCPHVELVLQTRSYECRRCGRCCTRISPQTVPASRQLQQSRQSMASVSPIPMPHGPISMSLMELPPNTSSLTSRSHQRSRHLRRHLLQRAAAGESAMDAGGCAGDFSDFTDKEVEEKEEEVTGGNRAEWDWGLPRSAQDNSAVAYEALASSRTQRKATGRRWGGGGGGGDDFQQYHQQQQHHQQQQQQPQQSLRGYLPELRSHRQYHHSRRRY